jgi:serine/threonine protein kinase
VSSTFDPPARSRFPRAATTRCLPGSVVGDFTIQGLVGEGGFGIVYQAFDNGMQREVALKEYMPNALARRRPDGQVELRAPQYESTFAAGRKSFVNEAKLLAQFDHKALVKVLRFFEANGTAYMVMPLYHGRTLKQLLREQPKVDEAWIKAMLAPLLDALETLHGARCFHRDVRPDNILILDSGGPLLLDFGAARRIIGDMTQAVTVVIKPGYAPVEQYADDNSLQQGPWTDIYALAAVVRLAITGKPPATSVTRMVSDPVKPLAEVAQGYSAPFLRAIDYGLAVRPEDRPQSIAEFRHALGLAVVPAPAATPAPTPTPVAPPPPRPAAAPDAGPVRPAAAGGRLALCHAACRDADAVRYAKDRSGTALPAASGAAADG